MVQSQYVDVTMTVTPPVTEQPGTIAEIWIEATVLESPDATDSLWTKTTIIEGGIIGA